MWKKAAFILAICLATNGCGFGKSREDAERAVARHFDAIASHAEEAVLAGYDDRFYTSVPREEWARRLAKIESKVGEFQSFKVVSWSVNNKLGTDGGTYVTVACEVTYSKYPAQERMVLFRSKDNTEFKILQHGVNSEAFLKE
jgi:hypothetical protein